MKKGYIGLGLAGLSTLAMIGTCESDRRSSDTARQFVDGCEVYRVIDPEITAYGAWVGERPNGPNLHLEEQFYTFLRRANKISDINDLRPSHGKGVLVPDLNGDHQITAKPFTGGPVEKMNAEPTGRFADSYGIEP
jgi:hypothetical protein